MGCSAVFDGFIMVQMDYASYVAVAVSSLRGLSSSKKIAILAVLALIALIAYLRSRNTTSNNMRRARELHRKAIGFHEKGKAEEAAGHYKKAAEYRERAEAQK